MSREDKVPSPRADRPDQVGRSQSASGDVVGVNRRQEVNQAQASEPAPGRPIKQHNERDESPADQVGPDVGTQQMRRAGQNAPPVGEQAFSDIQKGIQDTDLYNSGNRASPQEQGGGANATADWGADDPVRRSGNDV